MRRTIRVIALSIAITIGLIAMLWIWRIFDYFERSYPPSLYFASIRAIDADSSKPVDFSVKWNVDTISSSIKISAPARVDSNVDQTKTIAIVGKHLKEGLQITIESNGYAPQVLYLDGRENGILARPARVEEVRLQRASKLPAQELNTSD